MVNIFENILKLLFSKVELEADYSSMCSVYGYSMRPYKSQWYTCKFINDIVAEMMSSDLKLMTKDQYLIDGGYSTRHYFE